MVWSEVAALSTASNTYVGLHFVSEYCVQIFKPVHCFLFWSGFAAPCDGTRACAAPPAGEFRVRSVHALSHGASVLTVTEPLPRCAHNALFCLEGENWEDPVNVGSVPRVATEEQVADIFEEYTHSAMAARSSELQNWDALATPPRESAEAPSRVTEKSVGVVVATDLTGAPVGLGPSSIVLLRLGLVAKVKEASGIMRKLDPSEKPTYDAATNEVCGEAEALASQSRVEAERPLSSPAPLPPELAVTVLGGDLQDELEAERAGAEGLIDDRLQSPTIPVERFEPEEGDPEDGGGGGDQKDEDPGGPARPAPRRRRPPNRAVTASGLGKLCLHALDRLDPVLTEAGITLVLVSIGRSTPLMSVGHALAHVRAALERAVGDIMWLDAGDQSLNLEQKLCMPAFSADHILQCALDLFNAKKCMLGLVADFEMNAHRRRDLLKPLADKRMAQLLAKPYSDSAPAPSVPCARHFQVVNPLRARGRIDLRTFMSCEMAAIVLFPHIGGIDRLSLILGQEVVRSVAWPLEQAILACDKIAEALPALAHQHGDRNDYVEQRLLVSAQPALVSLVTTVLVPYLRSHAKALALSTRVRV